MKSDKEFRLTRWLLVWDKGCDTIKHIFRWGVIAWCAWCVKEAVSSLAGATTLADIQIGVLISFLAKNWVCHVIAGAAMLWAGCERWLRLKKIKHFSPRVTRLERRIDPKRSSSQLTPTGGTRPEDK